MGLVDDLLDDLETDIAERGEEGHFIIGTDRYITVPEELKKIAVQHDHNIETVTFDCPRYWDDHDMSQMRIYVNYMRSDDEQGCDLCTNVKVDDTRDSIMHFDWTITGHLTAVPGNVTILVCVKKVGEDGSEANHWNSELNTDCYVSQGLECESKVIEHNPGIITSLLARMDYVEEIATPETMQNYVNDYLDKNPDTPDIIKNYLYNYMSTNYPTTEDAMNEYVHSYLDKHPHLFVIGSNKPVESCLWFNTDSNGEVVENTVLKLTGESGSNGVYAEVGDTIIPGQDLKIT